MLLVIDIGNTNGVFAVYEGRQQLASWRYETRDIHNVDGFHAEDFAPFDILGVIVSSVVPAVNMAVSEFCRDSLGLEAVFVSVNNAGIEVDVSEPERVGVDRIVNAVAARAEYKLPAVVIDVGTATTFDVVNSDGVFIGGVIAPGVKSSLDGLYRVAAKLPKIALERADRVIGRSTEEAMKSGVFLGYVGLIEKITADIIGELGMQATVIATGGLAPLFAEHIEIIETVDDSLTLKGLVKIYEGL